LRINALRVTIQGRGAGWLRAGTQIARGPPPPPLPPALQSIAANDMISNPSRGVADHVSACYNTRVGGRGASLDSRPRTLRGAAPSTTSPPAHPAKYTMDQDDCQPPAARNLARRSQGASRVPTQGVDNHLDPWYPYQGGRAGDVQRAARRVLHLPARPPYKVYRRSRRSSTPSINASGMPTTIPAINVPTTRG
jgi:hypothetical protein